jgi:5-methylcytosine-specific restriction endonuclease McrA
VVYESPIRPGGKPYPNYSELELDHKRALHQGGDESPENCQLLCCGCHKEKTKRERRLGGSSSLVGLRR